MKRKIAYILALILSLAALTACGTGNGTIATPAPTSAVTDSGSKPTASPIPVSQAPEISAEPAHSARPSEKP